MSEHLTSDDVKRFARGELAPGELARLGGHARACDACTGLLRLQLDAAATLFRAGTGEQHLDPDSQLFPYVEGRLDAAARERADAHLRACAACRADVEDLRALDVASRHASPRRVAGWGALAAAALLAVIFAAPLLRKVPPRHPLPPGATAVIATATPPAGPQPSPALEMPAVLRQLRPSPSAQRGSTTSAAVPMQPAGVVVETGRPRFTWPAMPGAVYEVGVFEGTRRVAASGPLKTAAWTPVSDLPRGVTLAWQVEVRQGELGTTLPPPALPPLLFRVLGAEEARAIGEARRATPADHLRLGILYARAGVVTSAVEELKAAVAAGQPGAAELLKSVEAWQVGGR
jgi:anti-sigma factor RsiW